MCTIGVCISQIADKFKPIRSGIFGSKLNWLRLTQKNVCLGESVHTTTKTNHVKLRCFNRKIKFDNPIPVRMTIIDFVQYQRRNGDTGTSGPAVKEVRNRPSVVAWRFCLEPITGLYGQFRWSRHCSDSRICAIDWFLLKTHGHTLALVKRVMSQSSRPPNSKQDWILWT